MEYEINKPPETESSAETASAMIEHILVELAFEETPDLAESRQALLAALTQENIDVERRKQVIVKHSMISEAIANSSTGSLGLENINRRALIQIALTIYEARIFLEANLIEKCAQKLELAYQYARQDGFDSLASGIDDILDKLAD